MLTFEALAQFDESAGSLVATVALKKTRASLTLLAMTSFGDEFLMATEKNTFSANLTNKSSSFILPLGYGTNWL